MSTVLILTGQKGVGKSTIASWVVALARVAGLRVDGLLAPPLVTPDGEKIGILGIRLGTGEQRRLADRQPEKPGERVGPWRFPPEAIEWSLDTVMDALRSQTDLAVVDELGPLELLRGEGLAPVIPLLASCEVPLVLVIVRESLVSALQERLAGCDVRVYRADVDNRERLPEQIAREWFPDMEP